MNFKTLIVAISVCLPAGASQATQVCEFASSPAYREASRLVDSLRPQKWGQARVYAYDGSEFTAGQVLWMKGQMRALRSLCGDSSITDPGEAARVLNEVQGLIEAHRR